MEHKRAIKKDLCISMGAHFSATKTTTVQHYGVGQQLFIVKFNWKHFGSWCRGEEKMGARVRTQRDQSKLERNYTFICCTCWVQVSNRHYRSQKHIVMVIVASTNLSVCKLSLFAWRNVNELHARLKFASLNREQIARTVQHPSERHFVEIASKVNLLIHTINADCIIQMGSRQVIMHFFFGVCDLLRSNEFYMFGGPV